MQKLASNSKNYRESYITRHLYTTCLSPYPTLGDFKEHLELAFIGIAPITQYTCVHNKNSTIQGSSSYVPVVKVIYHTLRNCSERKKFAPSGEVPILKRDVIVENHCLIQWSPFDVRDFFSVLATPLAFRITLKFSFYCCQFC